MFNILYQISILILNLRQKKILFTTDLLKKNCKLDFDGDGYFDQSGCGTPIDCSPGDSSINQGASDAVCNGVDNDCDGIEATARLGFWKWLQQDGYERSYVVYERSLKDG